MAIKSKKTKAKIPKVVMFSPEQLAWLKGEAEREGTSASAIVRRLVDQRRKGFMKGLSVWS